MYFNISLCILYDPYAGYNFVNICYSIIMLQVNACVSRFLIIIQ